jgi:hypothetical protein
MKTWIESCLQKCPKKANTRLIYRLYVGVVRSLHYGPKGLFVPRHSLGGVSEVRRLLAESRIPRASILEGLPPGLARRLEAFMTGPKVGVLPLEKARGLAYSYSIIFSSGSMECSS